MRIAGGSTTMACSATASPRNPSKNPPRPPGWSESIALSPLLLETTTYAASLRIAAHIAGATGACLGTEIVLPRVCPYQFTEIWVGHLCRWGAATLVV